MDYRIIIETEASGREWYYVQYRYLLFFWKYHTEIRDISMCAHKVGWNTLEEAVQHIQSDINWRYSQNQKKIVKRVVLKDFNISPKK
jgi:hypothetical protein